MKNHKDKKTEYITDKPKVIKKNYHVSSQTAYHIQEIALQENMTEGRVIDKIMRTYLSSQRQSRTTL